MSFIFHDLSSIWFSPGSHATCNFTTSYTPPLEQFLGLLFFLQPWFWKNPFYVGWFVIFLWLILSICWINLLHHISLRNILAVLDVNGRCRLINCRHVDWQSGLCLASFHTTVTASTECDSVYSLECLPSTHSPTPFLAAASPSM